MMQKRYVWAIALLCSWGAQAQTLNDPIYLNFTSLPKVGFDNKAGNLTTRFVEINATAPPLQIGNKTKVLNAVYYRNSTLAYPQTPSQQYLLPEKLHDIRYSLIVRVQLNPLWELVAIPRVMLRSDLSQSINQNDFFPQVAVLATYAIGGNPNFKIGFGGALNNDFARNAFVPLGSVYYDSQKLKIEIVYPNAHVLYKQSEGFEFGLFASVDGAISRVGPFETDTETAHYLRSFQLLVAPVASYQISKQLFGHLRIGLAPIRSIEAINKDFQGIQNQLINTSTGFFWRAGISIRLNK